MVKLFLTAEIAAPDAPHARVRLDAFREATLPSRDFGITLCEARLRKLTLADVEVELKVEPEDDPVRGSFDSGDPERDKAMEDDILRSLDRGDVWAWCCVVITAKWKGWRGEKTLGRCSYESEEDFREKNDYYDTMVEEALDDLNAELAAAFSEICELAE